MRGPHPCADSPKGYEAAVIGDVIAITVFAFPDRLRGPRRITCPAGGQPKQITILRPVRVDLNQSVVGTDERWFARHTWRSLATTVEIIDLTKATDFTRSDIQVETDVKR